MTLETDPARYDLGVWIDSTGGNAEDRFNANIAR